MGNELNKKEVFKRYVTIHLLFQLLLGLASKEEDNASEEQQSQKSSTTDVVEIAEDRNASTPDPLSIENEDCGTDQNIAENVCEKVNSIGNSKEKSKNQTSDKACASSGQMSEKSGQSIENPMTTDLTLSSNDSVIDSSSKVSSDTNKVDDQTSSAKSLPTEEMLDLFKTGLPVNPEGHLHSFLQPFSSDLKSYETVNTMYHNLITGVTHSEIFPDKQSYRIDAVFSMVKFAYVSQSGLVEDILHEIERVVLSKDSQLKVRGIYFKNIYDKDESKPEAWIVLIEQGTKPLYYSLDSKKLKAVVWTILQSKVVEVTNEAITNVSGIQNIRLCMENPTSNKTPTKHRHIQSELWCLFKDWLQMHLEDINGFIDFAILSGNFVKVRTHKYKVLQHLPGEIRIFDFPCDALGKALCKQALNLSASILLSPNVCDMNVITKRQKAPEEAHKIPLASFRRSCIKSICHVMRGVPGSVKLASDSRNCIFEMKFDKAGMSLEMIKGHLIHYGLLGRQHQDNRLCVLNVHPVSEVKFEYHAILQNGDTFENVIVTIDTPLPFLTTIQADVLIGYSTKCLTNVRLLTEHSSPEYIRQFATQMKPLTDAGKKDVLNFLLGKKRFIEKGTLTQTESNGKSTPPKTHNLPASSDTQAEIAQNDNSSRNHESENSQDVEIDHPNENTLSEQESSPEPDSVPGISNNTANQTASISGAANQASNLEHRVTDKSESGFWKDLEILGMLMQKLRVTLNFKKDGEEKSVWFDMNQLVPVLGQCQWSETIRNNLRAGYVISKIIHHDSNGQYSLSMIKTVGNIDHVRVTAIQEVELHRAIYEAIDTNYFGQKTPVESNCSQSDGQSPSKEDNQSTTGPENLSKIPEATSEETEQNAHEEPEEAIADPTLRSKTPH